MKKISLLSLTACALGLIMGVAYATSNTIEFRNIGPNFDQTRPISVNAGTSTFLTCKLSPKLTSGTISVYGLSATPPTVGMDSSINLNDTNNVQILTATNNRVKGYLTTTSNFGSAQIRVRVEDGGISTKRGMQTTNIECLENSKHINTAMQN